MKKILWAILFISVLLMVPAIKLRIENEENNKSVIIALDYGELSSYAKTAGTASPELDKKLEEAGITAIIFNPTSNSSFYNAEGFNSSPVEILYTEGFEIIPRISGIEYSKDYLARLEDLIRRYEVRYILICPDYADTLQDEEAVPGENVIIMNQIIDKHNLTIFILENSEQTGYAPVPGLEALITASDYHINRAFSISGSRLSSVNREDTPFIWLRAVIDRNIRLICIEPTQFATNSHEDDAGPAVTASAKLTSQLLKKGFTLNNAAISFNTSIPGPLQRILIAVNILAGLTIYFSYLGISKKKIVVFAACLIPASLPIVLTGPEGGIAAAFEASLIYPSLSSLIMLKGPMKLNTSSILRIIVSLATVLFINLIGGFTIASAMCDIRYTMHLVNFNVVIPAYIIPLCAFLLNFVVCTGKKPPRIYQIKEYFTGKKRFIHNIIYILILLFLIFIYIERSGNYNIIPVLKPELELRKLLETAAYARPRSKEFLVGYPSLFAFAYLYGRQVSPKILVFLGIFSAVTGISIVNSFCHGYTPVLTSISRTMGGLALGIITGAAAVLICKIWMRRFCFIRQ